MICDIKNSLEANPGSVSSIHKCDVGLQCINTETGPYGDVGDISCPAVELILEDNEK